jgi:hypothetical protein
VEVGEDDGAGARGEDLGEAFGDQLPAVLDAAVDAGHAGAEHLGDAEQGLVAGALDDDVVAGAQHGDEGLDDRLTGAGAEGDLAGEHVVAVGDGVDEGGLGLVPGERGVLVVVVATL